MPPKDEGAGDDKKSGTASPSNPKETVVSNLLETDTMRMLAEVMKELLFGW